jgi:hypothetical protein
MIVLSQSSNSITRFCILYKVAAGASNEVRRVLCEQRSLDGAISVDA